MKFFTSSQPHVITVDHSYSHPLSFCKKWRGAKICHAPQEHCMLLFLSQWHFLSAHRIGGQIATYVMRLHTYRKTKKYISNIYTYATREMTSMNPPFYPLPVPKITEVSNISKPLIRKCPMKNIVAPACAKNIGLVIAWRHTKSYVYNT